MASRICNKRSAGEALQALLFRQCLTVQSPLVGVAAAQSRVTSRMRGMGFETILSCIRSSA